MRQRDGLSIQSLNETQLELRSPSPLPFKQAARIQDRKTEDGPAWAIYREQMAEIGVEVVPGKAIPEHFYRASRKRRKKAKK